MKSVKEFGHATQFKSTGFLPSPSGASQFFGQIQRLQINSATEIAEVENL